MGLALIIGATVVAQDIKSGSSTTPFESPVRLNPRVSFEVARFLCFRAKGPAIHIAQPNGLGIRCNC